MVILYPQIQNSKRWVIKKRCPCIPKSSLLCCYLSGHAAGFSTIEWLPDFIGPVPPSLLIISLLNFLRLIIAWVNHTCKVGNLKFSIFLKNTDVLSCWEDQWTSRCTRLELSSVIKYQGQTKRATTRNCCSFCLNCRYWKDSTYQSFWGWLRLGYYKAFGNVKNQIWLCCSAGAFCFKLIVTSWGALSSS